MPSLEPMPHRPDCSGGSWCECDAPDPNDPIEDGYDPDLLHRVSDAERRVAEQTAIADLRNRGITVPERYEPASPRYAIAYWLASLVGELTSAELAASDCMDDADELLAELLAAGLTVVPTDSDVVRDWRNGECFDPECRGGWIWVDIDDDGESIRQRCPQCEVASDCTRPPEAEEGR